MGRQLARSPLTPPHPAASKIRDPCSKACPLFPVKQQAAGPLLFPLSKTQEKTKYFPAKRPRRSGKDKPHSPESPAAVGRKPCHFPEKALHVFPKSPASFPRKPRRLFPRAPQVYGKRGAPRRMRPALSYRPAARKEAAGKHSCPTPPQRAPARCSRGRDCGPAPRRSCCGSGLSASRRSDGSSGPFP